MPRVSVLMAHAGAPTFLAAACRSLESQSYRDFELVVVDDGAALDWDVYLRTVRFPWRVLSNGGQRGLAHSLNRAARAAAGSLLARMDSDDVSAPSRLELQVACLDARPAVAFSGSAVYWLDQTDRRLGRNFPLTDPEDLAIALAVYNQLCHGSMLMRREAFERLGGYDEAVAVAQDYELWLRALRAGHDFANVPEPVYGQRLHAQSVSSRAARRQSDLAGQLSARESTQGWNARVESWFAAGRQQRLGRSHERLQLGRLAVLFLAALASTRVKPSVRPLVLRFIPRHVSGAAELLAREVGWRHDTALKVAHLLRRPRAT
ncbi:MAG: hypothetical protein RL033_1460 [Pseudomonadota bacterium]